jgi:hypothetical protein
MARKRSIVVVRTPQQALAYTQAQNAGLAAARASSLAAAKKAKAEIARGKNIAEDRRARLSSWLSTARRRCR